MREATAATAQVESTRRLMAEDESELAILGRRITEMNNAIVAAKQALAAVEHEQQEARPEIESKRAALMSQLEDAKRDRDGKAVSVSRPMLGKYDRIRGKRTMALYALRGGSCGNCDTAVPLQRRNMMAGSGEIEVCEACGVLLYADGG
jgi:predicted  nucleic acid-binding Zn-ribbon protein